MERSESIVLRSYRTVPIQSNRRARDKRESKNIPWPTVSWVLIFSGLLFGRAMLLGELMPFGIAFIAALRGAEGKHKSAFPALGVLIGMSTLASRVSIVPYLLAAVVVWALRDNRRSPTKTYWYWLGVSVASVIIVKGSVQYFLSPLPVVILQSLTEAVFVGVSYALFYPILARKAAKKLAHDEMQWIIMIGAGIVGLGFSVYGLPIRYLFLFYVVIAAARLGGVPLSSMVAVGCGVLGLLLQQPHHLGVLVVLLGVLAGALKQAPGGLFLAALTAPFFVGIQDSSIGILTYMGFTTLATVIVYLTPKRFLRQLERIIPGTVKYGERKSSHNMRVRKVMAQKVDQFTNVFEELAHTLSPQDSGFLAQQLRGIADVVRSLNNEFSPTIQFAEDMEEALLKQFDSDDIEHITVVQSLDGYEVYGVRRKQCKGAGWCSEVARKCSEVMDGKRYEVVSNSCSSTEKCGFTIMAKPRYRIEVQVAKKASKAISGDSEVVFELSSSKIALLLSDGMGVGSKAAAESSVAIRLLEKMILAGYSPDTAVRLLNQSLLLRSSEESFVTIDMVLADLHQGQLEFVKIGSAPSFIKRGHNVEVIHNASLPVGILNQVDVDCDRRLLKEGEFLIMVTDGVLDIQRNVVHKDEWLCSILRRLADEIGCGDMAQALLTKCLEASGGRVEDDLMVLVARLVREDTEIHAYRRRKSAG